MSDIALQPITSAPLFGPAISNLSLADQERRVLAELASGHKVGAVLNGLLVDAEARAGGHILTSILYVAEDGAHLLHGAAPNLPAAYCEAINGIPIGEGVGSCGTAAARGEPVYVSDIAADPLWADFRALAAEHHLGACWSTPIMSVAGRVLGTFAVYYRDARQPTGEDIAAVTVMANTAALAIERHLLDRGIARLQAEGDTLLKLGDALRDAESIEAMTAAAGAIVGQGMGLDRAMYGELTPDRATVEVATDWHVPGLTSISGSHPIAAYGAIGDQLRHGEALVIDDVVSDPRTAADAHSWLALGTRAVINMPITERGEVVGILIAHSSRPRMWLMSEVALVRNAADRVTVAIGRRRAEDHQTILNGEIAHRLKNTLSMVQSMAAQTLGQFVPADAMDGYTKRLQALGAAHDALTSGQRIAADVETVVRGALRTAGVEARCALSGPAVTAGANAALSLSLVLHELATNAIKYGALSSPDGQVDVIWRLSGEGSDREFGLDWRERGGPPVVAPTRKGFGTKLLRYGLGGTGGSAVRYEQSGVEASFRSPLSRVEAA